MRESQVPVLHTDRLTLRGHRPSDFAASLAMWTDPVVVRHISGKPSTPEQVWARMLAYTGHWQWHGFGYWLVEEKATQAFVGELGFADFKRDIEPSFQGAPELGWVLATAMHGKGYATEATRAALAWGDRKFEAGRTVCIIDPTNLASIGVAQKIGFVERQRTTYKGDPTLLFERKAHVTP